VAYIIIFPLKEEAVHLIVQGSKTREDEVLRVFEESVQSLVNLRPYVVSIERTKPGKVTHAVIDFVFGIVLPIAISILTLGLLVRFGNSQAKANKAREVDKDSVDEIGNSCKAGDHNATAPKRPIGLVVVALLELLTGIYIAYQLLIIVDSYVSSTGPVTFDFAFKVNKLSQLVFVIIAFAAAIGMFIGIRWGWWLGTIHWGWYIGRQVIVPTMSALFTFQSVESITGVNNSQTATRTVIYCLFLWYLFTNRVINFCGFTQLNRALALLVILGTGVIFSIFLHI